MNKPIYLIGLFFVFVGQSWLVLALESESNEQRLLRMITFKVIAPQHETLSKAVDNISSSLAVFCEQKNENNYVSAQHAWKDAMKAWSSLSAINFGPIDSLNISWRFQFWPDPINLVARKFKSRLSGRNNANTPENLAAASHAIQGLSALEFLLFDEQVAGVESYQTQAHLCEIALATAQNLFHYSKVLHDSWVLLARQRTPNESSTTIKREVERLYSGWVMSLGTISQAKLGRPLGLDENLTKNSEGLNPWLLESWRSRSSIPNIEMALKAAKHLYEAENGFSWYLAQKKTDNARLDKKIRHMFRKIVKRLSHISLSAYELINLEKMDQLKALNEELATLYLILKLDYAKAAELNFRFNAHDGD